MKKYEWINGNKMKFESGFTTFDKQTNYISTGNVSANTQLSLYIRPRKETNNGDFKVGELQAYDLKLFNNLPMYIKSYLNRIEEKVILYEFRHRANGKKIVDGYVITDKEHNFICRWTVGKTYKSELAINEAMKYICN